MLYEHITEWGLAIYSQWGGGRVREDGVGGKGEEKGGGKWSERARRGQGRGEKGRR